jgi:hypothetical protein
LPGGTFSGNGHIYSPNGISKNKTLDLRQRKDAMSTLSNSSARKRSKYKMLNPDIKRQAVNLAREKTPRLSAETYNVPLKSLKRWMKVGWQRKKGGGRKTKDPDMEKKLYDWYSSMKCHKQQVTAKMIKDKALELRSSPDFIASKGWLDKFKIRYRLEICKESCSGLGGSSMTVNTDRQNTTSNQGY